MTGPRIPPDRGSVTAELALALPAVVAVLVLAMVTTGALLTQIRCADAARAGARVAALGEDLGAVRAAVAAVADPAASVEVARSGPWVEVRVQRRVMSRWGPLVASARSTAWVEPGLPRASGRSDPGEGVAGIRGTA